jgi:heat shock protein HspQ
VGAVALVVTSLVGQRLGRQQMVELRGVVFDVVPTSAQTLTTPDAR